MDSQPYVCATCREAKQNHYGPCPHATLHALLVDCDSELSAIAHGRPPSSKEELIKLSDKCRQYDRILTSTIGPWSTPTNLACQHMDDYDDYDDEPCGSCENCGCNLYPEDDFHLCDQCQWSIEQCISPNAAPPDIAP